ncbi:MAG: T9SS type A sorting domain-containing protein [Calditrichia bacterium]
MKIFLYSMLCIVAFTTLLSAQNEIPNPGFENWTGGEPNGWFTSNLPGILTNVTETGDANSGSSAILGELISGPDDPIPPIIGTGNEIDNFFPITQNYSSLNGFYKLDSLEGSFGVALAVSIIISDAGRTPIATGSGSFSQLTQSYLPFNVPIVYFGSGDAAFASIIMGITASASPEQTTFATIQVDDLEFAFATGVEPLEDAGVAESFKLMQNYPNPFNPSTTIEFSTTKTSNVKLTIFNPLGQEVETLVNEELTPGSYKAEWQPQDLSGGIYFYQLETDGFVQTRKLVLLK